MKKILTNNLALKILSILIGILIWYVVVSVNDPVVTEYFNSIPVQTTNTQYINNEKQTYLIAEEYQTVRVAIRDNKSKIDQIEESDIKVTADFTQIVDLTQNPVYVPLHVECAGISAEHISTARTTIPIEIEQLEQETFPVSVDTGTSKPGKKYEIGKMTPNPQNIVVSGPASIIKKIGSIIARIDVTDMMEDGSKTAELRILDKNGDAFSDSTFKYLTFEGVNSGEKPSVNVSVELWEKKEIQLDAEYSGEPGAGYQVTEVKVVPSELTVAGSREALDALAEDGDKVTIPAELVDIDGATTDTEIVVDLEEVLPEGTKLISATDTTTTTVKNATVKVTILENESKEYSLDMAKIEKRNMQAGLVITYSQPMVTVRLKASDRLLSSITEANLESCAFIDLSNKGEGDYTVNLNFKLPAGYELANQVSTKIHLEKSVAESAPNG